MSGTGNIDGRLLPANLVKFLRYNSTNLKTNRPTSSLAQHIRTQQVRVSLSRYLQVIGRQLLLRYGRVGS